MTVLKVAIGADHAGFGLKQEMGLLVKELGHDLVDLGTHNTESVDYPDFAEKVARAVQSGAAQRGIMVCGSGVGACIAANKVAGIRAAICHDTYSAHQGVEHDDMNVLVMGGRIVGGALAREIAAAFLGASFSNEDRHVRRLNKVLAIEERR